MDVQEVPAPSRLAPFALARTAEPLNVDEDHYSGRFVLLHDPDGVEEWGGTFRVVIFLRASLETDVLRDELVREVAWSWIQEATTELAVVELGGTVTSNFGQSFGSLSARPPEGFVEVRASWTPREQDDGRPQDNLGLHLSSWITALELAGGLNPLPVGVIPMNASRSRV